MLFRSVMDTVRRMLGVDETTPARLCNTDRIVIAFCTLGDHIVVFRLDQPQVTNKTVRLTLPRLCPARAYHVLASHAQRTVDALRADCQAAGVVRKAKVQCQNAGVQLMRGLALAVAERLHNADPSIGVTCDMLGVGSSRLYATVHKPGGIATVMCASDATFREVVRHLPTGMDFSVAWADSLN